MSHQEDITKITLNSDQQDLVQKLDDFMASPEPFFRVDGPAGTGKSTSAAIWGQRALANGVQMAFAAPTNKAARQLRVFKNKINPAAEIPTGTIFSLLGLILGNDGSVREVRDTATTKLDGVSVVLLDEWSQVNDQLMLKIKDYSSATNTKFIFMGDPYQLPPVGQEESSVMNLPCGVRLNKVERHDNQILTFATYLRECIDSGTQPVFKSNYDEGGGVSVVNSANFYRQLKRAYTSEVYDESPDAFKCLSWRNAMVDNYNESIRDAMYNDKPAQPFEIGERIVAKSPVLDVVEYMASGKETFLATTDEEGTVQAITKRGHPVYGEIEVYCVLFTNELGRTVAGYVPSKAGQRVHLKIKEKLAADARESGKLWPKFWQFVGMFADLAPCHAITVHRSQGSTFRTAFLDVVDIMSNRNERERLRMLYTGATRPSKTLVLRA